VYTGTITDSVSGIGSLTVTAHGEHAKDALVLGTPFDVGSLEAHSPAMRPTDERFRMPGSHATFEEDR
jgi:hypothetical protein